MMPKREKMPTTEARLFDTYYPGRHARRHAQREASSLFNSSPVDNADTLQKKGDEEDDILLGEGVDDLTPEERELFKQMNLPETFVGGFRENRGERQRGTMVELKNHGAAGALLVSTYGHFVDESRSSSVTHDDDVSLLQSSSSQPADARLVPGFYLWQQAFDGDYQQYYYYRENTRQTQWEPPTQGFVPLSYQDVHLQCDADVSVVDDDSATIRFKLAQSEQAQSVPHPKYWAQRHRFFSLFDHGIRLDKEAWFSVTPERIANHQAKRCHRSLRGTPRGFTEEILSTKDNKNRRGELVVLDAFCGVAGNTIAFARRHGVNVIAYDTDEARLELASHNADVYGVRNSIDFVCDDVIAALKSEVVGSRHRDTIIDMIFLSPPWGGPKYIETDSFDLQCHLVSGLTLVDVVKLALAITPNVACFLPRNADLYSLVAATSPISFEVEKNFLNGKFKAQTVYFGALIDSND